MDPFLVALDGRLNAIEFILEQLASQQCMTADDPVENAEAARARMAVLASRSTAPGLAPEEAEAVMKATTEALDRIMVRVVRRVREASAG